MYQDHPPLLTIGLPFYNNEDTLQQAITSVILQSYKNWELILINDGSFDASNDIAFEIAKTDQRIKLIDDKKNKGLVFRLNQIIDLANGEYIARMDADDMMLPEKLNIQIHALIQNKKIDVIDTASYTINERDEPIGMRGTQVLNTQDKKGALKSVLLFHPTVIGKTEWFRKNKYSEDFIRAEDYELWCRTFNDTVFFRIKTPLFLYREGNVNVKNYALSMKTVRKILRQYGPSVLSKHEYIKEIIKTYLKSYLYRFFGVFNLQQYLSAKRNVKLNNYQVTEIKSLISLIKNKV